MRTLFLVFFILNCSQTLAQTESEEAIILNQEMQFLEDAAALRPTGPNAPEMTARSRATKDNSLEETYFGEESEDSVSTRLSSPKKRGF